MKGRRGGFTLIEMMLALSALIVIFGLCTSLLHSMFRLDRFARAQATEGANCARLARQFRSDVRASDRPAAEWKSDSNHVELSLPTGTVRYQAEVGRITRIESEGARVRRRDAFVLPSRGLARFVRFEERGNVFISMLLPKAPETTALGVSREIRIDAHLGKDRRVFADAEAKP